jgi:hypothetical protein
VLPEFATRLSSRVDINEQPTQIINKNFISEHQHFANLPAQIQLIKFKTCIATSTNPSSNQSLGSTSNACINNEVTLIAGGEYIPSPPIQVFVVLLGLQRIWGF